MFYIRIYSTTLFLIKIAIKDWIRNVNSDKAICEFQWRNEINRQSGKGNVGHIET